MPRKFRKFEPSFAIQRGVIKHTRDQKLGFIRSLPEVASEFGVNLFANLGMSAVELVHRHEIRKLLNNFERLTRSAVQTKLEEFATGEAVGLAQTRQLHIMGVDVIRIDDRSPWIGALLIPEDEATIKNERISMGTMLSEMVQEPVDLPSVKLYMNIGRIDGGVENAGPLLEYIVEMVPESVDVYEVDAKGKTSKP